MYTVYTYRVVRILKHFFVFYLFGASKVKRVREKGKGKGKESEREVLLIKVSRKM